MTYDEWLSTLNRLIKNSFKEDIEKVIKEPPNENLRSFITPKIKDAIREKFNYAVTKIKANLELLFEEENELDLELVSFKKTINTIVTLIHNQQFKLEDIESEYKVLKEDTDEVYEILIRQANKADDTGVSAQIIKRNRIKWSD